MVRLQHSRNRTYTCTGYTTHTPYLASYMPGVYQNSGEMVIFNTHTIMIPKYMRLIYSFMHFPEHQSLLHSINTWIRRIISLGWFSSNSTPMYSFWDQTEYRNFQLCVLRDTRWCVGFVMGSKLDFNSVLGTDFGLNVLKE